MNNTTMIFGAPGCGKTTYLLNLLEELLKENDPDKISFVSFTRKGSYEGRDRAMEKFGLKEKDFPYFRTIHSIAFRDLGISMYDMISRRHYKEFSTAMGMNFVGYYTEDLVNNDDQYLFYCSLEKNNKEHARSIVDTLDYRKVKTVRTNYERFKKEMNIIDFDDLLMKFIDKNEPIPVDIAIIDEAQDLTSLQWKFCSVAFRNCKKIFIAGDDDQAIYQWSGADINKFLSMSEKSTNIILDKSYRLKENLLEYSKKVSQRISHRVSKDFEPVQKGGNIFFHNRLEDIEINSEESYYFLSRNNYFLPKYASHLKKKGLVFHNKAKYSVDLNKYEAIKKYENLRKHSPDKIRATLSVSMHLRKDLKVFTPWYYAFDMTLEESNYYRDLFRDKTNVEECNIHVNTIHGVKGGEADNVVLKLDVTKNVYNNFNRSKDSLDSELRCLYVGITRAKKNLHIIHSKSKFGFEEIL